LQSCSDHVPIRCRPRVPRIRFSEATSVRADTRTDRARTRSCIGRKVRGRAFQVRREFRNKISQARLMHLSERSVIHPLVGAAEQQSFQATSASATVIAVQPSSFGMWDISNTGGSDAIAQPHSRTHDFLCALPSCHLLCKSVRRRTDNHCPAPSSSDLPHHPPHPDPAMPLSRACRLS
jgi:hypothetical protein